MGATVSGAAERLAEIGKSLGMAFQLVDDLLDLARDVWLKLPDGSRLGNLVHHQLLHQGELAKGGPARDQKI